MPYLQKLLISAGCVFKSTNSSYSLRLLLGASAEFRIQMNLPLWQVFAEKKKKSIKRTNMRI